jgi:glycosyltransferase involved in cell wall biosynthesis
MKILYIGTLPPHNGGSAIVGYQLLDGLAKSGHTIKAISPITKETLWLGDKFAAENKSITITRYNVPYFESSRDKPASDEYRRIEGEQIKELILNHLKIEKPDIIIIGRETFAWDIPDIALTQSIPTVLLIHGTTTFGILRKTIPVEMANNLLKQFRKVNLLIIVARHLKHNFIQFGLENIKVIENTIDTDKFTPAVKDNRLLRELKIDNDSVIVIHISNLKPLKRPFDIVDAADYALKENSKLVFVIVGNGLLRSEMEEKCKQRGIYDRFRFVNWVEYDRVPDYTRLADIVVMPSEAEARALVYLETQACGRLLIASDIPAAREVIVDWETGLLFRKGDITDLSSKLLFAASNPEFRTQVGIKARKWVENYPLSELISNYELTLQTIIKESTSIVA